MKKLPLLLSLFITLPSVAKPVETWEQAIDLSMALVNKQQETLTRLPFHCVLFVEAKEIDNAFIVDVRENHNAQCGGDPETAPRLFSVEINKQTGESAIDKIVE
ncbi:hypothetical protein [Lonepinella koalarum]|uniref:hypothetical protein n=1 Tax=Lonepinella koalarum TaxID=53417 RepID=UPI003F6DADCE